MAPAKDLIRSFSGQAKRVFFYGLNGLTPPMAALESMGKDPLQIGLIAPTPGVVNQFSMIQVAREITETRMLRTLE